MYGCDGCDSDNRKCQAMGAILDTLDVARRKEGRVRREIVGRKNWERGESGRRYVQQAKVHSPSRKCRREQCREKIMLGPNIRH